MRPSCLFILIFGLILNPLFGPTVYAQGQDSTPGDRYLRIVAEWLPGRWDNANQHYFDKRRNLPGDERHRRTHLTIEPVEVPGLGAHVFLWRAEHRGDQDEAVRDVRLLWLLADGPAEAVAVRLASIPPRLQESVFAQGAPDLSALAALDATAFGPSEVCTWHLLRDAGGFRGRVDSGRCGFPEPAGQWISLSAGDLFLASPALVPADGPDARQSPYWLERARTFHCYADVPGVGGGRDEPFDRYDDITLHDKGGLHWFTTRDADAREIGVSLQSVTWHVLNEDNGNFNRNSLVIYVVEKLGDGTVKEHGYAFTEPKAERIGVNLKWMLVNCSLVPRDEARPEL